MRDKIITANRLSDGRVVFLSKEGTWSPEIDESRIFPEDEAEAGLRQSIEDSESASDAVNPYLVDVEPFSSQVTPSRLRERIRMFGPSVETRS